MKSMSWWVTRTGACGKVGGGRNTGGQVGWVLGGVGGGGREHAGEGPIVDYNTAPETGFDGW